jgi:hypothetical protein
VAWADLGWRGIVQDLAEPFDVGVPAGGVQHLLQIADVRGWPWSACQFLAGGGAPAFPRVLLFHATWVTVGNVTFRRPGVSLKA